MPTSPYRDQTAFIQIVDNGDLSGSVVSSSFDCSGFNQITIQNILTWAAASAVAFTLEHSEDGGTTWSFIQSISVSAGTATCTNLTYSKAVSASANWTVNINVNYSLMRLTYTSTGGTTDLIDVLVKLGVVS